MRFLSIALIISILMWPACIQPVPPSAPGTPTEPLPQTQPATEPQSPPAAATHPNPGPSSDNRTKLIYGMKGVGIRLPQSDFAEMKAAGIDVLATEWGMEQDINEVKAFLDQAQAAGLKVIMDGGFSYTAWGFTDDDWDKLPRGKHPVWQKDRVQSWVKALKYHPAIYAWDICNEFGENLPSGADIKGSDWPKGMITANQIKQARADVLEADSTRPIQVRMYEWDIGKMPRQVKSVLEDKTADIISLNLYSNYMENGKLQWPDIIEEGGPYFVSSIKKIAPETRIWLSIAVFEYHDQFQRPTPATLSRDLKYAKQIPQLDAISFFDWGPDNKWDPMSDWYLPKTGADLWAVIKVNL